MSIGNCFSSSKESGFGKTFITTAVVTNIKDESDDKIGKVKVKYLTSNLEGYESDFIRVMSPMAGQGWGMAFWPEIDQEVLVAFLDGDISRPYIIGCLYNSENKPPYVPEDEKNNLRVIKTKSGHTLTFNDEEEKTSVSLVTAGEQLLEMVDEDGKKSIKISDKSGDNSIEIKSDDGECTIQAKKKVVIKAGQGTITVDDNGVTIDGGSKDITIKGTKIAESGTQVEIKANSNLSVESSGPAAVKGAVLNLN